tara:strand:- start:2362 stop:3798 length:1437 start_codon:yes stop_codon:yes gene_type:complete
MKKLLTVCVCLLILVSCQREVSLDNSTSQILNLDTASIASNIGIYKGVFTTLDSKERATVEITITDATRFASTYGNRATAVLNFEKGNTVTATAVRAIELGESIQDLVFESPELTFVFSVENDGNSPTISNVSYNNTPSDILIVKHSTRNPVNPVLGTFICTGCNGNTTVTNAVSQTFNMTLTAGVVATQAVVDGSSYLGDGLEATSADNGDGTSSAAVSGSVTTPDSTVDFAGTHTFSTTGDDCSEVTGTWTWNTNGVTGTFESDTSCDTSSGPVELINEDFEDATVGFVASFIDTSNETSDYFRMTDGTDIIANVTNIQGSRYFGAMDTDGVAGNGSSPAYLTWDGLDVSGLSTITMNSFFAEDDDGSNQDWDTSDFVKVQYSFDGGSSWTTFFAIEAYGTSNGYNGEPAIDTDFDGTGDGASFAITDNFENFTTSFDIDAATNPTASNTMSIRFEIALNSGDEDIAIDNVIVTGN